MPRIEESNDNKKEHSGLQRASLSVMLRVMSISRTPVLLHPGPYSRGLERVSGLLSRPVSQVTPILNSVWSVLLNGRV